MTESVGGNIQLRRPWLMKYWLPIKSGYWTKMIWWLISWSSLMVRPSIYVFVIWYCKCFLMFQIHSGASARSIICHVFFLYVVLFLSHSGYHCLSSDVLIKSMYQFMLLNMIDKILMFSWIYCVGLARLRRTELAADSSDASTSASFDCTWTSLSNLLWHPFPNFAI